MIAASATVKANLNHTLGNGSLGNSLANPDRALGVAMAGTGPTERLLNGRSGGHSLADGIINNLSVDVLPAPENRQPWTTARTELIPHTELPPLTLVSQSLFETHLTPVLINRRPT